jgi:hypothetical protein
MKSRLRGCEHLEEVPRETAESISVGAESGAVLENADRTHLEVAAVVAAWPMLAKNVRAAILILVRVV